MMRCLQYYSKGFMLLLIAKESINFHFLRQGPFKIEKRYKAKFTDNAEQIEILGKVVLMTPENIHINSFMYEPIIDMSGEHLKNLYNQAKELNPLQVSLRND